MSNPSGENTLINAESLLGGELVGTSQRLGGDFVRLRVVLHFSSGIVEGAKRERVKITPRDKRFLFWRGVIFTRARVSLALLSLRKNGGLLVVYDFVGGEMTVNL